MLNFIYYPISWILWLWHYVFAWLFGAVGIDVTKSANASGAAWALGIVFLTVTVRLILLYPMVKQIRTTQKMAELQPQMKAIQKKYAKDKQRQSMEIQKLQKENGVNMMMGCLPMFVQIPVFIGLFHVLRMFNKMGSGPGGQGMTAAQTRASSNYFFKPEDVQSFLDSRLFGAPLSGFISQPKEQYRAFFPIDSFNPDQVHSVFVAILCVTIPLLIISAVATHMNARVSIERQAAAQAANPQAAIMNKMMLWGFPLMILGTGVMWHVGLLTYMVTNNIWTFFQQFFLYRKIDKEKAEARQKLAEAHASSAPRPGVKPKRDKRGRLVTVADQSDASDVSDSADSDSAESGKAGSGKAGQGAGQGASTASETTASTEQQDSGGSGAKPSSDVTEAQQRQQAQRARQQAKRKQANKPKKPKKEK